MEDEWTTVMSGGRLVKFTYADFPKGALFSQSKLPATRSCIPSFCNMRNTHLIAQALNATSPMNVRLVVAKRASHQDRHPD